jgi:hypothetical protein
MRISPFSRIHCLLDHPYIVKLESYEYDEKRESMRIFMDVSRSGRQSVLYSSTTSDMRGRRPGGLHHGASLPKGTDPRRDHLEAVLAARSRSSSLPRSIIKIQRIYQVHYP